MGHKNDDPESFVSETRKRKKERSGGRLVVLGSRPLRSVRWPTTKKATSQSHLVPSIIEGDDGLRVRIREQKNSPYALLGWEKALAEIAKKMGISREAARIKAKKAVLLIRRKRLELSKESAVTPGDCTMKTFFAAVFLLHRPVLLC
jgi:hypothetical protein